MNQFVLKNGYQRRTNNVLTLLIVLFALYVLISPVLPQMKWLLKDKETGAPYAGQLFTLTSPTSPAPDPEKKPEGNRIVIPSALIDQPIYEGSSIWVIEHGGSWRKNLNTTSPEDFGNTVIIGHRFTYKQPEGAFYHLDKVTVGDKLAIYWNGEELLYTVSEKKVVAAEVVEVEQNTSDRRLTLYTCTPLVTAENRLVITALPDRSAE